MLDTIFTFLKVKQDQPSLNDNLLS